MPRYYVNKNAQDNGDHEVHQEGCSRLPLPHNRLFLGIHSTCQTAVREARRHYRQSNGCFYCARACHTG
ncbi:hypothetical protein CGI23_12600 [Vibrio parahaemolyticus]|nr:hypothetical protein CGK40_24105 [Vibrio parahaemolyticus]TOG42215.1 hypothetical protein CGJ02_07550 [Vibrio parahaemolyticus]TOK24617.1 hypothetical protein CGI23_12600 [Vibrio parahaemolyticus]